MLQIEFTAEDVARTRFAVSPLWEVVACLRVLRGADEQGLHRRWVEQVRPRIAAAGLDLTPLSRLVPMPTDSIPGFLVPPPTTPQPSLAVELATLRATPYASLRTTSDRARPGVDALREDPERGLGRLADTIGAFWEVALAPYWPRIRTLLEGDILYRATRFAEGGARRLFDDLDPQVGWDAGALRMVHRRARGERRLDGQGLLLVPSAFIWPRIFSTVASGVGQPTLRYPPRSLGDLWQPRRTTAPEALAAVIGRSRALLLAELTAPAATKELARRTGLTPGGVSQQLTAMRSAGLVTAHRTGRLVLYARTSVAETLLTAAAD
ncbi:winged helix-turn-helix domain-containing protein [Streptomyces sp. E11-3]|uniref:ArsR/SmtB family transcription factor n=1 Tax=Streptomyces sp. E11-3 TaxID=3110112 RepID=UPI00398071A8